MNMMRFDKFTNDAQEAAIRAYEILQRYGHSQLDTEHLFLALLESPEGSVSKILGELNVDADSIKEQLDEILQKAPKTGAMPVPGQVAQVYITPRLKRVTDMAQEEMNKLKDELISTEHLFLGIASERNTPSAAILRRFNISRERILQAIPEVRQGHRVTDAGAEGRYRILEKYSRDLTAMAREGKLDPVIGRDAEILRIVQVLSRRTKNNPVLIGDAGVGKTAIVEGLAQKIADNDVPEFLMGKQVLSLDLGAMVAGTRFRGEFEERLKAVLDEIQRSEGEVIVFIDEIHTVVGAGAAQGAMDAANMMKPALSRGELRCVGATTPDEYRQHIEKDSALERRFAPVWVDEPTIEETLDILRGVRDRYEAHHQVQFTDAALEAAVRLSNRYVTERQLPDKAIDLIDEAAAKLRVAMYSMPPELKAKQSRLQKLSAEEEVAWSARDYEKAAVHKAERLKLEEDFNMDRATWRQSVGLDEVVEAEDIAQIVASWTGIPVTTMLEAETQKLLRMEEELHKRLIGQDEAIHAVADAIRRARSGLKDPRRPIGSFIFIGPSGVGKTELARALAEFMFDDEDALLRVDMSEYREQHTVSRLFGAPPGYVGYEEGGQLTEAVRRRPYRVVLFDEVEKAHPEVWNSLLQVLEDGRMTDGQGRTVDFRNTVLIMTSNIGTQYTGKGGAVGFLRDAEDSQEAREMERKIERGLKETFRPEFLNRIDEVIVFRPLTMEQVEEIVVLNMRELQARVAEQGVEIELSGKARKWLAEQGFDPAFGARPLRRAIQRYVESPLSRELLRGNYQSGDKVVVDVGEEGLTFTRESAAPIAVELPARRGSGTSQD